MNQKLIQLDSNRRQLRSRLLNQSIVMLAVEGVFEQIVLYGQEMSSEYINLSLPEFYPHSNFTLKLHFIFTLARISPKSEMFLPYNKLLEMHIIFLVLLELVLGNAILDCQDSKGLSLLDFLSLYQGYTISIYFQYQYFFVIEPKYGKLICIPTLYHLTVSPVFYP